VLKPIPDACTRAMHLYAKYVLMYRVHRITYTLPYTWQLQLYVETTVKKNIPLTPKKEKKNM